MKVLLMCTEDPASENIRDRLLEEGHWEQISEFHGRPVRTNGNILLFEKEGLHLYFENVDREISRHIAEELPEKYKQPNSNLHPLELLVFLSKHRSEAKVRSLTVHTPGNYLKADYGGKDEYLPPSAPHEMTAALRALYREKKKLGIKDRTTYEVTHHGPEVHSPCFFIEIGSDEDRWKIPELGRAIARALLSDDLLDHRTDLPVAVGVGGGHYAPRFTDRAMRNKFSFGHMVPDYILSNSDDIEGPIRKAVEATKGVEYVFIHRSKRNEELLKGVEDTVKDMGLEPVD